MSRNFGDSRFSPEAYAYFQDGSKPFGLELSFGGSAVARNETGFSSGLNSEYEWDQTLVDLPLRVTGRVGQQHEKFGYHFGGGATAHFVSLHRELRLKNPAVSALGADETTSKTILGPHVQAGVEYFFSRTFGVAAFARYAYAKFSEEAFRGFITANSSAAFFSQGEEIGNIGGPEFGLGLALRF